MRSDRRNAPATASSPSEDSRTRTNARRRGFLLAVGAGTAGAAALAARSLTGVVPQTDGATPADDSKGYRLTDHVKRYYRTAKT
jgi:ferric-dicitrate binding protein FerR (iron transport regulator)